MHRPVLQIVTPPAELPVTLAQVKERLRIDHNDDDAALAGHIATAVDDLDAFEGALGRPMVTQTWDEQFSGFCWGDRLPLAVSPVQSVTSLKYIDSAGVEQTWSAANYELVRDGDRPYLHRFDTSWPDLDTRRALPITVRIVGGYGGANAVPARLKEAIMLHVGTLYEHRDAIVQGQPYYMPLGYEDLIRSYRRPWLGV